MVLMRIINNFVIKLLKSIKKQRIYRVILLAEQLYILYKMIRKVSTIKIKTIYYLIPIVH